MLVAGLKEWYNTNQVAKPPFLSSIKLETMKEILPLRKEYDYAFSIVLPNQIQSDNQDRACPVRRKFLSKGASSIDELYSLAKRTFNRAVDKYSFEPKDWCRQGIRRKSDGVWT